MQPTTPDPVPPDAPVTHTELVRLEARLERRFGFRLLGIVVVILLSLFGAVLYLDNEDQNRDEDEGQVLAAIQMAQANIELLLVRSGRNSERTCAFAEAVTELLQASISPDERVGDVATALDHLEESVAEGCEPADFEVPPTTTEPA